MEVNKVIKAPCNHCGPERNHLVVAEHFHEEWVNESGEATEPADYDYEYSLLECAGCRNVCLRICCTDHTADEGDFEEVSYYPPRTRRHLPHWSHDLPEEYISLLGEIYTALAADSRCLAIMGTRAVIDMALTEKVGDRGSFQAKLTALEVEGSIGRADAEYLKTALDAGNAAAHRAFQPTPEVLDQTIDIMEHLLQAVYILPRSSENIKQSTPRRTK